MVLNLLGGSIKVKFVIKDMDGQGWFEDGAIVINARWLDEDCEKDIILTFIHEYVEHVLGLGHERAVYAEKAVKKLLYG